MAIRVRKNNKGSVVALCAAQSKPKKGDIYLNDSISYALSQKYYEDFKEMGFIK